MCAAASERHRAALDAISRLVAATAAARAAAVGGAPTPPELVSQSASPSCSASPAASIRDKSEHGVSDCGSAHSSCGGAAAHPGTLPREHRMGRRRRGARAALEQCAAPPAVFENPTYESAGARCAAVHLLLAELIRLFHWRNHVTD